MKKIISYVLFIVMLFSIFSTSAFAGIPDTVDGAGLSIIKVSGDLDSPGSSANYKIVDAKGNPITDFSNYNVDVLTKVPLEISKIRTSRDGSEFTVSLLDNCSISDIKYSGSIKFTNKTTNESVSLSFDGTAKNIINNVSGDIRISFGIGSKIYDFSNANGTTTIVFGENAEVKLSGSEENAKCLVYNLDPNQQIRSKYGLTPSTSAFINFVGEPQFINKIDVTLMIPINASNPVLYQLKAGTTNELEEVSNYKLSNNGTDNVLTFEAMSLNKTYVITSGKIDGVNKSEEVIKTPTIQESVESTVDNSEDSPKTGSNLFIEVILIASFACCLGLIIKNKSKKQF